MNKFCIAFGLMLLACGPAPCAEVPKPGAEQREQQEKLTLLGLVSMVNSGISLYQSILGWADARFAANGTTPAAAPLAVSGLALPTPPVAIAPTMPGAMTVAATAAATGPYTSSPSYNPTPLILGAPDIGLAGTGGAFDPAAPWDSKANYQGVAVSALILDQQQQPVEIRSLANPLRAGERFKLRVVSTGAALVSVDALRVTPGTVGANGVLRGVPQYAGQMYPVSNQPPVPMKAGEVLLLPAGAGEFFTFGDDGASLLALHVRHPQAQPATMNRQPLYRQDSAQISTYSQLAEGGAYLALSQLIGTQPSR